MCRPATQPEPESAGASAPAVTRPPLSVWMIAGLLVLVTLALYWPVTGYDFVNYDDPLYVTGNPHVWAGLTWQGLAWAFGRVHGEGTYWHPLTWVSHMIDCQFYGLKPGGHHLTSVLFHAANAVLVFFVFRRMTGAFWRCVLLAALFALHPLQVDSVAWVAERKNVLSTFFVLLTLWAYTCYAEQSVTSNQWSVISGRSAVADAADHGPRVKNYRSLITDHRILFYALSLFFFACGLMCKPVLVTLPFVLLLLDYWPLKRMEEAEGRGQRSEVRGQRSEDSDASTLRSTPSAVLLRRTGAKEDGPFASGFTFHISRFTFHASPFTLHVPPLCLFAEKVPFFILAVASSLITVMAHHALGMLDAVARLPLDTRIANALVSYIRYLGKTFWPSRLAVFYPYPTVFPMWELVMCGLLLLVISGLVLGMARSRPWLLVGWFWFLGVLVPFSGLVQAGAQSMADRFMYVPAIGIFVAMLWELHGLTKGGRYLQLALTVAAGAALVLCLALTRQQIGYWKDSESLFRHALEATGNNPIALRGLGVALGTKGRMDEAIRQFQEGVRSQPEDADARHNLGVALFKQGQLDEASRQFQEAIRLNPDSVDTHYDLGAALHQQGHIEEAIRQFEEAIHLKPDYADAHNYLGIAVGVKGQMDEAIRQFQEAIRAKPDYAEAHYNLAVALGMKGQTDEAIRELQEALRIKPDYAAARQNLDAALATKAAEAKHGPAATARQRGE